MRGYTCLCKSRSSRSATSHVSAPPLAASYCGCSTEIHLNKGRVYGYGPAYSKFPAVSSSTQSPVLTPGVGIHGSTHCATSLRQIPTKASFNAVMIRPPVKRTDSYPTPVRLHSIARLARNERWRRDHTGVAEFRDQTMQPIACRSGLVTEIQPLILRCQLPDEPLHAVQRGVDLADIPDLAVSTGVGYRNRATRTSAGARFRRRRAN